MRLLIYTLALGICLPAIAADLDRAKPESVGMSSERLARIKPLIQQYVDDNKLAGITTVIARKGKIVHFETVGKLNLDTGAALQPDSLFRIYSMTKPIVTTAAMILMEEGKFELSEPVSDYLPAFKDAKVLIDGETVPATHDFTIGELMSHTAGLTYGYFGDTDVDKLYRDANIPENKDMAEMVEALGPIPLLYQPGTRWVYSVSVDVVGALIEAVAGQPLDQYLEERVFKPLGMEDTFFEVPQDKVNRFGTNHIRNEKGQLIVIDRPESSKYTKKVTFFSGGGGLVSTASDYLRYAQMMLNGGELNGARILSRKTIELMTTNHLDPGMSSIGKLGFGLGFGVTVAQPLTGLGSIGEYGWGGSAGTGFWIDPEEELTAVMMLQMMQNPHRAYGQFKNMVYHALKD